MSEARKKLSVRNLRKAYGPAVALADASIDLLTGEFLTLLGPSGSGKTTLLSIVAGLLEPDSGEVWIDGHLSTYAPPYRRDIGLVFQNYALFPHLTVAGNIAFPLSMRGLPGSEIARRVKRVLEIVRLPHVADRMPWQLSGGQQQRIALARCIVYEPSIVLMDEPLGALDKKLREEMQLEIKRLHSELEITVMYVTHDQEEALVLSDRICLMNEGRIEQVAPPHEMYFEPQTAFAATFLGDSNIQKAVVTSVDGKIAMLKAEGGIVVRAAIRGSPRPGQSAKIIVRPEHIRPLLPDEDADNVVSARIDAIILTGQVIRCFLVVSGGHRMVMSVLSTRTGGALTVGSEIRAGWSAQNSVLLSEA
jgi:putative spermidine/putrescine transport system ATP-binding protein